MKTSIAFIVTTFIGLVSANAAYDVTCVEGDCFTKGWDVTDMQNGNRSTVRCTGDSCTDEGWVTEFNGREQAEIVCKPGGCFVIGWRTFDATTGAQTSEISCYRGFAGQSDCLIHGWDTYSPQFGRYATICANGDCLNRGWEVRYPGYQPQVARCKEGGCFSAGWTVRP